MRYVHSLEPKRRTLCNTAIVGILTLTLFAWGCGGSTAEEGGVDAAELSFFDRLLDDESEPIEVTVPSGTLLNLTLDDKLSSAENQAGETFYATLTQEISVDGRVAIPRGSRVRGRISEAHQADKVGGRAVLAVDFQSLEAADSEPLAIDASLTRVGKSEKLKDSAIIAGSTVAGVILGEEVDKGEGGILGGIAGGVGGYFAAKKTGGKTIEIPAGTSLAVELQSPLLVRLAA